MHWRLAFFYALLSVAGTVAAIEPVPNGLVVLTFDDAVQSHFQIARPLLKEYGFPATLFVSTDQVGGGDFLDWKELRELQGEGVEIGNHSASHAYLLDRNPDEEVDALEKRILADIQRLEPSKT